MNSAFDGTFEKNDLKVSGWMFRTHPALIRESYDLGSCGEHGLYQKAVLIGAPPKDQLVLSEGYGVPSCFSGMVNGEDRPYPYWTR